MAKQGSSKKDGAKQAKPMKTLPNDGEGGGGGGGSYEEMLPIGPPETKPTDLEAPETQTPHQPAPGQITIIEKPVGGGAKEAKGGKKKRDK